LALNGQQAAQPERRYASDGKAYTKAEFRKFYSGYREWDRAKPALPEKSDAVQQPPEQLVKKDAVVDEPAAQPSRQPAAKESEQPAAKPEAAGADASSRKKKPRGGKKEREEREKAPEDQREPQKSASPGKQPAAELVWRRAGQGEQQSPGQQKAWRPVAPAAEKASDDKENVGRGGQLTSSPSESKPKEPTLEEKPLCMLSDEKSWEGLVTDVHLRSWMRLLPQQPQVKADDFDYVEKMADWTVLKGKTDNITRKTAWYVSKGCTCKYGYGTVLMPPIEIPDWLDAVTNRWIGDLCRDADMPLPDSLNLNLYEDGKHCVGWHSDDEALFGGRTDDCCIVSVSAGATRTFRVGLKSGRRSGILKPMKDTITSVPLKHGDICVMEGYFQKNYIHEISKTSGKVGARINATYRWIKNHAKYCPKAAFTGLQ
jgi:alkylated DNA repair dioxygenase AlkB